MRRFANILLWSVISAAFIGPGTVTTASSAGARFGVQLAWALVFSTIACIVLQEAVARLVIVSRSGLGEAIRERAGRGVANLVGFSIVLGCAAYEAGNILGGVAGIELLFPGGTVWWTLATGVAAFLLLWSGTAGQIARVLGFVVAVMGIAFVVTAIRLGPDLAALVPGSLVPGIPEGAELLALGLVGTTVVPYNLFLGAGLAPGQRLGEMRAGLVVAIALGGLISLAVMVVGDALVGEMSFSAVAAMLEGRLGPGGEVLFAVGLFAAGFSSAVTAPLAASMTVHSLRTGPDSGPADLRGLRAIWMGVLGVGIVVGMSGLRPVPVIVLAQALNGLVLPLVATLVLLAVNDRGRMRAGHLNGTRANLLGMACVAVTVVIGMQGVGRVISTVLDTAAPAPGTVLRLSAVIVAGILVLLYRARRSAG